MLEGRRYALFDVVWALFARVQSGNVIAAMTLPP